MVKVGSTLSATPASVTGDPTPIRSWQWLRDNVTISGATAADYYVQAADEGSKLSVRQIETNFVGVASATSAQTATVGAYDPGTLFESGEEGAWYDPSDSTTVFQDAAGTTPAGVGDPVGLILDKSKGLTLGAELFSDFATEGLWTDNGNGSWSITNAATNTDLRSATLGVTGKRYVVSITFSNVSGTLTFYPLHTSPIAVTSDGTYVVRQEANGGVISNGLWIRATTGSSATVSNISVKELPGNHATQTTSAARPILQQSGATPVLSGTELVTNGTFDADSDWTKGTGWSISGGQATHTGAAGYLSQNILTAGKVYKMTFDIVSAPNPATDFVQPYYNNSPAIGLFSSVGTHSVTATALSGGLGCALRGSGNVVIDNISVQEVTSWSGGLRYLDFDGVDDSLKSSAFASAQAQPNTIAIGAQSTNITTSYFYDTNANDAFRQSIIIGTQTSLALYSGDYGWATVDAISTESVLTAYFSAASSYLRQNGVVKSTAINPGSHSWTGVTLGARWTSTSLLNGHIYSFVGVNRTLAAEEISDLESYLAAKSGVTLP